MQLFDFYYFCGALKSINTMKKTLLIALAGMMMFAFTQCGGNGNANTGSVKGTKQFTETKKMYDELEKMIKDAKSCDELQEAAFGLVMGSLASGLGDSKYADDEKMTEKEQEKIEEIAENLLKDAEKKAEKLGCDLDD